jgi:hypothetical protein
VPVEQLFRRGDEPQALGHACEVEQSLDLRRAPDEAQLAAFPGQALVGAHDDRQAGRVHELQPAKVEDDELGVGHRHLGELGLQTGAGGEIEFTANLDQLRRSRPANDHLKINLHARSERTCSRAVMGG